LILAQREALLAAQARASAAEGEARLRALEIERLKLLLAKARREQYGQSSERGRMVIEQLELAIADLEETESAAQAAAELAAPDPSRARSQSRARPARQPLPAHLPRERVVHPGPTACPCCGGSLRKLGEDVTETLERVPASWKVVQHVREKLVCRACEAITQPPAPSHPIARGRAGPGLLAEVLSAKYGAHLPLHRQSAIYAREGVELDVSTLADWVGAAAATLAPLVEVVRRHVLAGARLHADDTPVPVLAKGKTRTGRL
jgi:transposase